MRNLRVDIDRIGTDLEAMSRIADPGQPWTRRAFSPRFGEGRNWLHARFTEAGLNTSLDTGGNLIGTRKGRSPRAGTIMLGSHSDTVPDGGRFDGIAGVIAALEVARTLDEHGITLNHDIAIVDFLAEEVSVFGVSCIGSRSMAGILPQDWLLLTHEGRTLKQAIHDTGGKPDRNMARDDIRAFLELHIEQGPVLETEGTDLGIVTAIAGIERIEIILTGRPDHAGTTPMAGRADALVAASALVSDIDSEAQRRASAPGHFTATTGEFDISPGAANVVAGRVRMLIDVRASGRMAMEDFLRWVESRLTALPVGITAESRLLSDNHPTPMDANIIATLETAAETCGASYRHMVSGAGHDAAFMARISPAAMIFIPSKNGRSHCPEEFSKTEDIALGAEVLTEAVIALDRQKGE
ncbi:MAG: Zn-dependent hydrolase [Paracoccus sp. (in: a-proteobacteria)]